MNRLIYFKDGNGFVDTINRIVGRWVWRDDQPFAQWMLKWAWEWTVNDLQGLNDDEWETMFVLSTPNPHTRTADKRMADELYWKKKTYPAWRQTRKLREELPTRSKEYKIRV